MGLMRCVSLGIGVLLLIKLLASMLALVDDSEIRIRASMATGAAIVIESMLNDNMSKDDICKVLDLLFVNGNHEDLEMIKASVYEIIKKEHDKCKHA